MLLTLFFACEESCSNGANSIAFSEPVPPSPEQKKTKQISSTHITTTPFVAVNHDMEEIP